MEQHVSLCLNYMRRALKREIALYESTMNSSDTPSIEHQHLWMAFKPGTLLYQSIDGVEIVSRLRSAYKLNEAGTRSAREWRLDAERIHHDGSQFRFIDHEIVVKKYDGSKPLEQLPAFPLSFHPEEDRVRRELIIRGKKFIALCNGHHYCYYNGIGRMHMLPGSPIKSRVKVRTLKISNLTSSLTTKRCVIAL